MTHASPYVKVLYNNTDLSLSITEFKYKYCEEKDDDCEFTIEARNAEILDLPAFQEWAKLTVIWGYIGDTNYAKRTVFVYDIWPKFSASGVTATIKCTNKSAILKSQNTKGVVNGTLDDLKNYITQKYGIKVKIPVQVDWPVPIVELQGGQINKFTLKEQSHISATGKRVPGDDTNLEPTSSDLSSLPGLPLVPQEAIMNSGLSGEAIINDYEHRNGNYTPGNKSLFATLKNLARLEKKGSLVIDGRDDYLHIFTRDFSQKPIKQYKWAYDRELIEFDPETKNRKTAGNADNLETTYTDPEGKSVNTFNVNKPLDGIQLTLGKVTFFNTKLLKQLPKSQLDSLSKDESVQSLLETNPFALSDTLASSLPQDTGTYVKQHSVSGKFVKMVQIDGNYAIQTPLVITGSPLQGEPFRNYYGANLDATYLENSPLPSTQVGKTYDSNAQTPEDALNEALNTLRESESERNKGKIKTIGDVTLVSSKVIMVTNISNRYSGKYYVTEMEHIISPKIGYICEGRTLRNAYNRTGDEQINKILTEDYGIDSNNETPPNNSGIQSSNDLNVNNNYTTITTTGN